HFTLPCTDFFVAPQNRKKKFTFFASRQKGREMPGSMVRKVIVELAWWQRCLQAAKNLGQQAGAKSRARGERKRHFYRAKDVRSQSSLLVAWLNAMQVLGLLLISCRRLLILLQLNLPPLFIHALQLLNHPVCLG